MVAVVVLFAKAFRPEQIKILTVTVTVTVLIRSVHSLVVRRDECRYERQDECQDERRVECALMHQCTARGIPVYAYM